MRRWTRRFFVASMMVGACLFGCDSPSASDPDGGTDTGRANGGAMGAGGVTGQGGAYSAGGAFAQGGTTSTAQQGTSSQSGDGGAPSPLDSPDAGIRVPSCGGSVQQDAPCTPGPDSACIPTSGGAVCLCLAKTWKCF
jgi:hypothetical protein